MEEEDTASDGGSVRSVKHSKRTSRHTKNWQHQRTLHKKQLKRRRGRCSEEDSDEETGESH